MKRTSWAAAGSLLKVTLRDLLWLALLVGSLTMWRIEHRQKALEAEQRWKESLFLVRLDDARPSSESVARRAAVRRFASLTDAQLDAQLASRLALEGTKGASRELDFEPCLTEMARRRMAASLVVHYTAWKAKELPRDPEFPLDPLYFRDNLEFLTALRRAQGKPDPLAIRVSTVNPPYYGLDQTGPLIEATITNVDVERESFSFTDGCDDRGGRRERWRFVLTDEDGQVVPDSNFQPWGGGGVGSVGPLEYGESGHRRNLFDLRFYIAPRHSGRYTLQVLYHNETGIARERDISGLMMSKSAPIPVSITVPPATPKSSLGPGVKELLAILGASGLLILATTISGRLGSLPPRHVLGRRDIGWLGVLTVIGISLWLDCRYLDRKMEKLIPDAKAKWSIAIGSEQLASE